jgi:nucleotide-binding universal stress UspA family protein
MSNLRHILFPYDFSPQGQHIAPFVAALARRLTAHVTILSVVPPTFESVPAGMGPRLRIGEDAEQWRRALQERLDTALVEEFSTLDVERVADSGDPAARIVDFAHGRAVDLIAMPTHGLGLVRSLLVGSVTSKVLHDVKCPVWTATHSDTQPAMTLPRSILCAVDGTPASSPLMQWTVDFSAKLAATLRFLHVVDPISDWPSIESEQRLQEQVREEARNNLVSAMKSAGVEAPYRVAVGEIVPAVTEEARQEGTDMVIIGRGSVSEPFGRLRSHAFAIIQRSPCPVLSV